MLSLPGGRARGRGGRERAGRSRPGADERHACLVTVRVHPRLIVLERVPGRRQRAGLALQGHLAKRWAGKLSAFGHNSSQACGQAALLPVSPTSAASLPLVTESSEPPPAGAETDAAEADGAKAAAVPQPDRTEHRSRQRPGSAALSQEQKTQVSPTTPGQQQRGGLAWLATLVKSWPL